MDARSGRNDNEGFEPCAALALPCFAESFSSAEIAPAPDGYHIAVLRARRSGEGCPQCNEGQHDSSGGCARRAPAATLGAILCAVRIDFRLPSKINPYPAQPATGVLGQRPKRVLVPFTRVKGTPRRRAVQAATLWWLLPAAGDCKLAPAGQAYRLKPFVKLPRR